MSVTHTGVPQRLDQRYVRSEVFNSPFNLLADLSTASHFLEVLDTLGSRNKEATTISIQKNQNAELFSKKKMKEGK